MGKYMRKAKLTGELAVMEVSAQSSIGVRTRARTLALQRLQKPSSSPAAEKSSSSSSCYLQVRSRRLEKPAVAIKPKEAPEPEPPEADGGMEVSFGENVLDVEARDSCIKKMGAASKQVHDESESSLEVDSDSEMETELNSVQSELDEGGSGREPESEYNDESNMDEGNGGDKMQRDAEMKELQREYQTLCSEEQDLLKKLKHHKDEDAIKGQAIKNQKALWDKALEFRFLIQKTFSLSNKLPQETVKSYFCNSDKAVDQAYSELISSSKHALSCILELQEALLENNPSITQGSGKGSCKDEELLSDLKRENDEEWSNICKLHHRISPFRNNSVDRWHRKTQVSTGAAVFRGKLNAFNQNISDQVDSYMRDPNRMIRRMQLRRSHVGVFGKVLEEHRSIKEENQEGDFDGDPELVDDSEFYQQLLKEFFESCDPTSSEAALYALKKLQPKKRKIVDRRVSKSRKIRYNIHEKIVNFMAPLPMTLPPMAPKLFENLFGMGNKTSSVP